VYDFIGEPRVMVQPPAPGWLERKWTAINGKTNP
jgi:hypothetical protein